MVGTREDLTEVFNKLIEESNDVIKTKHPGYMGIEYIDTGRFNAWRDKILIIIGAYKLDIPEIVQTIKDLNPGQPSSVKALCDSLNSILDLIAFLPSDIAEEKEFDCEEQLENIFNKFHKVVRQLRSRHENRATLDVKDEYDVQDLLHALLVQHFDDVRTEEWTPSYAGGACRMDFLLKDYCIVIETKKTRESMTTKQLGEELLIDREKYKSSADCKQLYCFVYDPEGHLGNPVGIKNDLEKGHEGFLKVFIKPE